MVSSHHIFSLPQYLRKVLDGHHGLSFHVWLALGLKHSLLSYCPICHVFVNRSLHAFPESGRFAHGRSLIAQMLTVISAGHRWKKTWTPFSLRSHDIFCLEMRVFEPFWKVQIFEIRLATKFRVAWFLRGDCVNALVERGRVVDPTFILYWSSEKVLRYIYDTTSHCNSDGPHRNWNALTLPRLEQPPCACASFER